MEAFGAGYLDFTHTFRHPHLLFAFGALVIGVSGVLGALLAFPYFFLDRTPNFHENSVFFSACLDIPGKHSEKAVQIDDTGNEIHRQ